MPSGLTRDCRMRMFLAVVMTLLALGAGSRVRAAELIMFEEPGCAWCQRWHAEIGPGYPKTSEGLSAPLRRFDFRQGPPSDIRLLQRVTATPTFVLVEGGEERGRILGYPGAQFFYPMLAGLIGRLPKPAAGSANAAVPMTSAREVPVE